METAVRRVRPGDADRFAGGRLSALRDAPSAFASSFEPRSSPLPRLGLKRPRLVHQGSTDATFLAEVGPDCVGLIGAFRRPGGGSRRAGFHVGRPRAPAQGASAAFWSSRPFLGRRHGADAVELWVTRGNYAAIAMYRNSGFTLKNEHQPLRPTEPGRVRMVLRSPRGAGARLSQAQSGSSGNPAYLTLLRSSCDGPARRAVRTLTNRRLA